ncbi:sigma factor-like helix-turn-helix DNA-binding protein [Actinoalloteichus caeruleus]|uniref:sigma factor-like helix-turn-helix DNA-binding protein n=1 Tax=Actinoalloteichus cyanogriseus TaxID=2893586 RepID=UPI003BB8B1AD
MDQNPSWSGPTRSRARATLPPRQRAVIVLRFSEDLTEERTATALWASRGTVTEPDRAGTRPAARCPAPGRGQPRREGPPSPSLSLPAGENAPASRSEETPHGRWGTAAGTGPRRLRPHTPTRLRDGAGSRRLARGTPPAPPPAARPCQSRGRGDGVAGSHGPGRGSRRPRSWWPPVRAPGSG